MNTGQDFSRSLRARFARAASRMAVTTTLALSMAFGSVAPAGAAPPRTSVVMDFKSGQVLSQRSPGQIVHPASLTKIMTLLLVFDALRDGRLAADQDLTVSAHAAATKPVKLGLPAGATIKVADAIKLVSTRSANDMAVVLAEAVAGSESDFATQMTARAKAIGMHATTFKNAHGLPDIGQITTAWDMALLGRHVIANYKSEYDTYMGLRSVRYDGRTYSATNRLLSQYRGMDGMKTGFINASGFNLVASAERNGRRLIGVIFGGATAKSRDNEMVRLLDSGFRTPPPRIPRPQPRPDWILQARNDNQTAEEGENLPAAGQTVPVPPPPRPQNPSS